MRLILNTEELERAVEYYLFNEIGIADYASITSKFDAQGAYVEVNYNTSTTTTGSTARINIDDAYKYFGTEQQ